MMISLGSYSQKEGYDNGVKGLIYLVLVYP